jgi:Leucine-rich repeat (LRR) protein
MSHTQISDAGLEHLKDLTGLQRLWLSSTRITGAGLAYLDGLTGLQRLDLIDTHVTDTGVQQLKQSLPNLTIVRDQGK